MMRIAFVLVDQMMLTSLTLPLEMWRAADAFWASRERSLRNIEIRLCSVDDASVRTQAGLELRPDQPLPAEPVDLVYLPALWRNPRTALRRGQTLLPWLRQQHAGGALIAAVGTGCALLAETGLLDGKAATTHWYYFDQFSSAYPQVDLKREYFITQAGSLYCAASINALADVTVHLIERLFGRAIAGHVERQFSYEVRRPFEKYRFLAGHNRSHPDELIVEVQLWLEQHYAEPVRLEEVARRFRVAARTLLRRFHKATDETPMQYLQRLRVDTARALLNATNLSISEIADRVGYPDPRQFARVFRARTGIAPREFRATVRAKLFSAVSLRDVVGTDEDRG
ncbi:MAG: helix-turn-helix domain-containing protein [Gammaproteobacteria bacterium]|nr:helix-turn-helix domain-containing protein [Gammaproteobacteria bacterium]